MLGESARDSLRGGEARAVEPQAPAADGDALLAASRPDSHLAVIVGFACHLAFVSYLVWPSAMGMLEGLWAPSASQLLLACKSACFVAAFFALCVFYLGKAPDSTANARRRAAAMAVGVIAAACLGAAAAAAGDRAPLASSACAAGAGCLLGLSTACGYAFWQQAISSGGSRLAAIETIAGTAIASAVYFFFVWLPGPAVLAVSLALFLAGSCPCLVVASRQQSPVPGQPRDQQDKESGAAALARCARSEAAAILTLAVIGFEWGALHALAADSGTGELTNLYSMGRLAAAGLMLALLARSSYRVNLAAFHRYALPALITAAALLPLLGDGYAPLLSCATYIVFGMASITLILACGPVASRYGLHVSAVYCGFFGIVYLSYELGGLLGAAALPALAALDPLARRLLVALATVYPAAMLGFLPACGANGEAAAGGARPQGHAAGAAPRAARAAAPQADRDTMAAAGLTQREQEVCWLISQGRDSAYVSEALGLSKNTVRFHTKAVYQKLGVHSRQELIDLFDARS